ncbi:MAG: TDP-N-acetylfucosamine:lipid II N-acetylfucosaminyltransferase [Bacteriovoracaceae bacterium]
MILHICVADKFIPPFISFVNGNFNSQEHQFYVFNKKNKFSFDQSPNLIIRSKMEFFAFLELVKLFKKADKVILHGLFWNSIVMLLALNAKSLNKCYWAIWGGDLYKYYDRNNKTKLMLWHQVRKFVISRLGHFITYIEEDYKSACKWYGAKGQLHESFLYLSNIYSGHEQVETSVDNTKKKILVGNSATAANRHKEAFKELIQFKGQIELIVPLSYGNEKYRKEIIKTGKEMFGEDFVPLTEFMPIQDYYKMLSKIDNVVFNHDRQQGMGNLIQLLGLGKKLFLDSSTPQFKLFQRLGVKVFDIQNMDINPLDNEIKNNNHKIISSYFSTENFRNQLSKIFETP